MASEASDHLLEEPKPELPYGNEKHFMACRECRLVLSTGQFMETGCPYCGDGAGWGKDELDEGATQAFSGFVGIVDGRSSWVARLIGKEGARTGVYAATLHDDSQRDPGNGSDEDDGDYDRDDDDDDDEAPGAMDKPIAEDDLDLDVDDFFAKVKGKH